MLVCATLFWAGNFNIGKFAYIESISPFTLAFLKEKWWWPESPTLEEEDAV